MLKIIADRLVPHAHKWWARIALFFVATIASELFLYALDLPKLAPFSLLAYSISFSFGLITFLLVYIFFRLPKCPNNTIGFLLAIKVETEAERMRLENDFYESIKKALDQSQTSLKFKVFLLPARISNGIETIEQVIKLKDDCNMRFVLYGDIRTRNHAGKELYVLRVVSMVSHASTNAENKQLLQLEMTNLLPAESRIDCKDDLEGFELTSLQFAAGATYTISVALFISGQIKEAIELIESLYASLKVIKKQAEIPAANKLGALIPQRLTNFLLHEIRTKFWKWRADNDLSELIEIETLLGSIPTECEKYPEVLTYLALCAFVIRRDIVESTRLVRLGNLADPKGAHHKYSLAFLSAYSGNLDEAFKLYRSAFSLDESDTLSVEVEEFIARIIEEEPEKYQLHFCLGLINFKKKKDVCQAQSDILLFLQKADNSLYPRQIEACHKYLAELQDAKKVA